MINLASYFNRNVGQVDQGLRALGGALVTWLAWYDSNDTWMLIGVIILLTSVIRFCPTYALLRFNTLKKLKSREPFSWEAFLDKNAPRAKLPVMEEAAAAPAINPVKFKPSSTFTLPTDLCLQLIEDVQNNAVDEMLVLRFYENFFDCRISIVQQHVHTYRCDFQHASQNCSFADLKMQLLERLQQQAEQNA
jgi:hypothetical protein